MPRLWGANRTVVSFVLRLQIFYKNIKIGTTNYKNIFKSENKMDNRPLIKWHALELYKLLVQDPNNPMTANIAVELETVFINSLPYKNIKAQPPKENK